MSRYLSSLLVMSWLVGVACTPGEAPPPPPPLEEPAKPLPPSAPGAVRAEAEVGCATLSWSAPAENGGAPLTGYQVESEPREASLRVTVEGTTARVTGLRAGGVYRFQVGARNEAGVGPVSTSESVTLPDVPAAPQGVAAARGNRQVEVAWTAPERDGGRPILGYLVTAHPQGTQVRVEDTARSARVTGLTNGVASTWTVRALNAVGEGPDSPASASVVPAGVPAEVREVGVRAGVRELTVTWNAPADTGGLPVTEYVVTLEPGGLVRREDPSARSTTFTGLRDGTEYTASVVVRNELGTGEAASAVRQRTWELPRAPEGVKAVRDVRAVRVSWEAPAGEGAPITGYTLEVRPSGARLNVSAGARAVTVADLPSTGTYSFAVTALNAVGPGPVSPATPPVRPLPSSARVSALTVPESPSACVSIVYRLEQDDGERADVLVEVAAPGGGTFRPATQAGSTDHEGTLARSTSSGGTEHRFLWNRALDVRGAASVQVRVSARVVGAAAGSRTVTLSLPAAGQSCEPSLEGAHVSPIVTTSWQPSPRLATAGDFDQDGKQDLIILSDPPGFLLMKGLGNGSFLPAQQPDLGIQRSVYLPPVVADLDGDGALDLLWQSESRLGVARGLGNGSFTPPQMYDPAAGPALAADKPGLVVADFNGDGRPDVAMGSGLGPGLFLNQGSGTFGAFQPLNVPTARLLSADLDADGRQDLVLLRHNSPGAVLLSNGDGTFRSRPMDLPLEPVLGNFDADGRVDALYVSASGPPYEVFLRRGDGQGGFAAAVRVATTQGGYPSETSGGNITAGDLDGDGVLDLALSAYRDRNSHHAVVLEGRGDGTFAPEVALPIPRYSSYLTTGDFNGDAVADLMVLQDRSQWTGSGEWMFRDVRVWPGGPERMARSTPIGPLGTVATGDLNGDGWADVISVTVESTSTTPFGAPVKLRLGGPGGLSAPQTLLDLSSEYASALAIDLLPVNADTALDVMIHCDDRTVLLLNTGNGTLSRAANLRLDRTTHVESGDVNKDGTPDLVFTAWNSSRSVYEVRLRLGVGDGTFAPATVLADADNLEPAVLGDLNRDGSLDVILLQPGAQGIAAKVLLGGGDGSFTPGPALALGSSGRGQTLRVADMTQDGIPDVVYCSYLFQDFNVLHVLKGTGDGSFTLASSAQTTTSCHRLLVTDLDGDGWRDVLGGRWSSDSVTLWSGRPQGQLAPERFFGTSLYDPGVVHSLAVLDANGDGRQDVLAGHGLRESTLLLQR